MRPFAFLALISAFVVYGYHFKTTVHVPDVTQHAVLSIPVPAKACLLNLRIHGRIDGSASIATGTRQAQRLTGEFDQQFTQPWSNSSYVIEYRPENVKAGAVTIQYNFTSR